MLINKFTEYLYNYDDDLLESPQRKNMNKFLVQVIFGTTYGILTGGVFLSGYLIYLGISDTVLSYVSLMQLICGMFVIFFVPWFDRQRHRKKLLISVCVISRFFQVLIVFFPLFMPEKLQTFFVLLCLFIGCTIAVINGIAFNTWFATLIPNGIKGRFFSIRQSISVICSLSVPILASAFLDHFQENKYVAFLVIYGLAIVSTIVEVLIFSRIDDVEIKPLSKHLHFSDAVKVPFKNREFMSYTIICCLFNLFIYIGTSFNSVYQIKYLEMSYTYINAIAAINFLLQIFVFYRFWGIVSDRIGCAFTFYISIFFYAVDCLLWSMMTKQTMHVIFPIMNILGAIGQSGFGVSLFNRRYELIPDKGKVIYDAFYSAVNGCVIFVSPLIGSFLRDFFSDTRLTEYAFGNFRIVYLISALLLLLLQVGHTIYMHSNQKTAQLLKKNKFVQCADIFKKNVLRLHS